MDVVQLLFLTVFEVPSTSPMRSSLRFTSAAFFQISSANRRTFPRYKRLKLPLATPRNTGLQMCQWRASRT